MNNAGYLSENSGRAYPWREAPAGIASTVPTDFLLSLRLYLCAWERIDVSLSALVYDAGTDAYTLTFRGVADGAMLLTGTAPRRLAGITRVGYGVVLGSGARVAILVPGSSWDAPAFGGPGSWTLVPVVGAAQVEPSVCVPGPATLRQILLNTETPTADPTLGVTLSLTAGAGVRFVPGHSALSSAASQNFAPAPAIVTLEAGTGLGEPAPAPPAPVLLISSINGQSPHADGAFTLGTRDCLRVGQPVVEATGGGVSTLLAHTLQLANDCGPCCGCADYRRMSRAIARRGAKLKDLCDATAAALSDAVTRYNAAAAGIDARRLPPARTESLFAQGSALHFTVRNAIEVPIFIYVAFDWNSSGALPELTLANSSSAVVYLGATNGGSITFASLVAADRATLPLLPATTYDGAARAFPFTGADSSNAGRVYRVNARTAAGSLCALAAGAGVRLDLNAASSGDPFAVPVAAGMHITLRAVSVQGANLNYPARGWKTSLDLVTGDPSLSGGSAGAGYVAVPPAS